MAAVVEGLGEGTVTAESGGEEAAGSRDSSTTRELVIGAGVPSPETSDATTAASGVNGSVTAGLTTDELERECGRDSMLGRYSGGAAGAP